MSASTEEMSAQVEELVASLKELDQQIVTLGEISKMAEATINKGRASSDAARPAPAEKIHLRAA